MSENPVDDFLEKISTPRKPLTDQEKREAMGIASQIRKKAGDLAKGKSEVSLDNLVVQNARIVAQSIKIYLGKEVEKYNHRHPDADLIIHIDGTKGIEASELLPFEEHYYFAPARVDKVVIDAGIDIQEEARRLAEKGPDELGRIKELETEEVYHPDKVDLTALLRSLSSATPKV